MSESSENSNDKRLVGLLAQFENPNTLVTACDRARQEGYKKMDAFSPFPVHGIDPAIGINRTVLPFIVLAIGLGACFAGLALQYYTNNQIDTFGLFPGYPFKISGKPLFSLPANIPVTFEIIVLSSAFATFLGMWALNGLPRLANPLHRISRFKRVTNDKFFLLIEAGDEHFDRERTESQLKEWGASFIESCEEDLTDHQLPAYVQTAGILVAFLCLLPPIIIFRASGMTNRAPRLHVVPDMDWQHKNKTQTVSPNLVRTGEPKYLFADGRAMRDPIPGTIARGRLFTDSEYYQGVQKGGSEIAATRTKSAFTSISDNDDEQGREPAQPVDAKEPQWVTVFPSSIEVNEEFLELGRTKFEIYCSVCHGYAGNGNGLVNQRAMALNSVGKAAWTAAKSLHDPEVKKNPVGRIFDTISNGRSSMGPYKDQISVNDRWAIVAYVKALQATGIQPESAVVAKEESTVEESTSP